MSDTDAVIDLSTIPPEVSQRRSMSDDDFAKLLTDAIPHLRGFARSLARSVHHGDDLVQDTMLKAWSARARFEPGTNFRAWTFTILRHAFISDVRRHRYEMGTESKDPDLTVARSPQGAHMELLEVQNALAKIAPHQREAILLVGAAGMSYDEAAAVCGCEVGTIKSRLSRARAELHRLVGGN